MQIGVTLEVLVGMLVHSQQSHAVIGQTLLATTMSLDMGAYLEIQ